MMRKFASILLALGMTFMASAKGFTAPGENFQQDVAKWLEKNGGRK